MGMLLPVEEQSSFGTHFSEVEVTGTHPPDFAICIHGGAGVIGAHRKGFKDSDLNDLNLRQKKKLKEIYTEAFKRAVHAVAEIRKSLGLRETECVEKCASTKELEPTQKGDHLKSCCLAGNKCLDIVSYVCEAFESSGLFNAGRGACLTRAPERAQELEASIMCGTTLRAGSALLLRKTRNPVHLASAIMKHTEHVMLAGPGAEEFGREHNIPWLEQEEIEKARENVLHGSDTIKTDSMQMNECKKRASATCGGPETVGCVVMLLGHVAAATSTGGRGGKLPGRIGDSPLIGAGNYANNGTTAVSATGHGEFFQIALGAFDIHARMKYVDGINKTQPLRMSIEEGKGPDTPLPCQSCEQLQLGSQSSSRKEGRSSLFQAIRLNMSEMPKGAGGYIALDAHGNLVTAFNSDGMYRAYGTSEKRTAFVGFWKEEEQFVLDHGV